MISLDKAYMISLDKAHMISLDKAHMISLDKAHMISLDWPMFLFQKAHIKSHNKAGIFSCQQLLAFK